MKSSNYLRPYHLFSKNMSWIKFIFLVPLANILALSMNIVKFSEVYAQKIKTFQSGIRQETPEAELRKILTLVFSNNCILLYGSLHVINGKISSLENDICCEVWLNKEHLEKKKCFKSGQREHAIILPWATQMNWVSYRGHTQKEIPLKADSRHVHCASKKKLLHSLGTQELTLFHKKANKRNKTTDTFRKNAQTHSNHEKYLELHTFSVILQLPVSLPSHPLPVSSLPLSSLL